MPCWGGLTVLPVLWKRPFRFWSVSQCFSFVAFSVFAFLCHSPVSFHFINWMEQETNKWSDSVTGDFLLHQAVLTWGAGTCEVITKNLPSDLRPLVNVCLLVKALLSFPLPFYSAAEILQSSLLTGEYAFLSLAPLLYWFVCVRCIFFDLFCNFSHLISIICSFTPYSHFRSDCQMSPGVCVHVHVFLSL